MGMLGVSRRVLLVGGEGVVLYAVVGKSVRREVAVSWDVPNFSQLLIAALLKQNRARPVVVVFDGADQTYRREDNIPKLSFIDRPRFVKRKLELAFPNYPIRASLGIAKGRAAPSAYLFVALPEVEHLDIVSDALLESGVPVAGFGLLPIESKDMVSDLAEALFEPAASRSRWTVLITQHEAGGLRQIVTKDGHLSLTRLTPTTEAGPNGAGWVEDVQREFKATLSYISRFGYTPDEGLDVIVVCGDIERQFFNDGAMTSGNFRCIGASEALRLIGAAPGDLQKSNFADGLHAAWAAKKRALTLPVRVPGIHRIMAPRLAARLATVALFLGAIGFGVFITNEYQAYLAVREDITGKQAQRQMMEREYAEESKVFDSLPVRPEVVKGTMAVKNMLDTNTIDPSPFLRKLRAVLGADVTLQKLSFEHDPGDGFPMGGEKMAAIPSNLTGAAPDRGKIKVSFQFSLSANVPLEQKVQRAEQLQKDLQTAFAGYDVVIVSQFGKVTRDGRFSGAVGDATSSDPQNGQDDYAEITMSGVPL